MYFCFNSVNFLIMSVHIVKCLYDAGLFAFWLVLKTKTGSYAVDILEFKFLTRIAD